MRFLMIIILTMTLFPQIILAKTVTVDVNGLICDFCAQSLKKVIGKEEGVNAVDVDLTTKAVQIDMDDNAELSDEKINSLVTDSGYEVVAIRRD